MRHVIISGGLTPAAHLPEDEAYLHDTVIQNAIVDYVISSSSVPSIRAPQLAIGAVRSASPASAPAPTEARFYVSEPASLTAAASLKRRDRDILYLQPVASPAAAAATAAAATEEDAMWPVSATEVSEYVVQLVGHGLEQLHTLGGAGGEAAAGGGGAGGTEGAATARITLLLYDVLPAVTEELVDALYTAAHGGVQIEVLLVSCSGVGQEEDEEEEGASIGAAVATAAADTNGFAAAARALHRSLHRALVTRQASEAAASALEDEDEDEDAMSADPGDEGEDDTDSEVDEAQSRHRRRRKGRTATQPPLVVALRCIANHASAWSGVLNRWLCALQERVTVALHLPLPSSTSTAHATVTVTLAPALNACVRKIAQPIAAAPAAPSAAATGARKGRGKGSALPPPPPPATASLDAAGLALYRGAAAYALRAVSLCPLAALPQQCLFGSPVLVSCGGGEDRDGGGEGEGEVEDQAGLLQAMAALAEADVAVLIQALPASHAGRKGMPKHVYTPWYILLPQPHQHQQPLAESVAEQQPHSDASPQPQALGYLYMLATREHLLGHALPVTVEAASWAAAAHTTAATLRTAAAAATAGVPRALLQLPIKQYHPLQLHNGAWDLMLHATMYPAAAASAALGPAPPAAAVPAPAPAKATATATATAAAIQQKGKAATPAAPATTARSATAKAAPATLPSAATKAAAAPPAAPAKGRSPTTEQPASKGKLRRAGGRAVAAEDSDDDSSQGSFFSDSDSEMDGPRLVIARRLAPSAAPAAAPPLQSAAAKRQAMVIADDGYDDDGLMMLGDMRKGASGGSTGRSQPRRPGPPPPPPPRPRAAPPPPPLPAHLTPLMTLPAPAPHPLPLPVPAVPFSLSVAAEQQRTVAASSGSGSSGGRKRVSFAEDKLATTATVINEPEDINVSGLSGIDPQEISSSTAATIVNNSGGSHSSGGRGRPASASATAAAAAADAASIADDLHFSQLDPEAINWSDLNLDAFIPGAASAVTAAAVDSYATGSARKRAQREGEERQAQAQAREAAAAAARAQEEAEVRRVGALLTGERMFKSSASGGGGGGGRKQLLRTGAGAGAGDRNRDRDRSSGSGTRMLEQPDFSFDDNDFI